MLFNDVNTSKHSLNKSQTKIMPMTPPKTTRPNTSNNCTYVDFNINEHIRPKEVDFRMSKNKLNRYIENPCLRNWKFNGDNEGGDKTTIETKNTVDIDRKNSNGNISEYEKRLDNISYEGKTTSI